MCFSFSRSGVRVGVTWARILGMLVVVNENFMDIEFICSAMSCESKLNGLILNTLFILDFFLFLQIRKKLPKVNRQLAARILENEGAEDENKDADVEIKKTSKKKKVISSDIFKDERFAEMFRDEV